MTDPFVLNYWRVCAAIARALERELPQHPSMEDPKQFPFFWVLADELTHEYPNLDWANAMSDQPPERPA